MLTCSLLRDRTWIISRGFWSTKLILVYEFKFKTLQPNQIVQILRKALIFLLQIFNHLATACQTMSSLLRAKVSLRMIVFINSNDMSSNSSLSRTWLYSTIKESVVFNIFRFSPVLHFYQGQWSSAWPPFHKGPETTGPRPPGKDFLWKGRAIHIKDNCLFKKCLQKRAPDNWASSTLYLQESGQPDKKSYKI